MQDRINNNLIKIQNNRRNYVRGEISRLGSVQQRDTTYRRNGMLNFGARQLFQLSDSSTVYVVGVGGPPVVG